ncbi:hypothetical protein K8I61_04440 [bacterium]|nr:hypothetical protein [bacterium]
MGEPQNGETDERKVFIVTRDTECGRCGKELDRRSWVELMREPENMALCMECSDLGKLEFLPTGDAALTRRAKKGSATWAVVLKWSRARNRYERQGLIVEPEAMEEGRAECLADAED